MTRETRVGTVMASSFLCLLGIVIASKWHGVGHSQDMQELQDHIGPDNACVQKSPNPLLNHLVPSGSLMSSGVTPRKLPDALVQVNHQDIHPLPKSTPNSAEPKQPTDVPPGPIARPLPSGPVGNESVEPGAGLPFVPALPQRGTVVEQDEKIKQNLHEAVAQANKASQLPALDGTNSPFAAADAEKQKEEEQKKLKFAPMPAGPPMFEPKSPDNPVNANAGQQGKPPAAQVEANVPGAPAAPTFPLKEEKKEPSSALVTPAPAVPSAGGGLVMPPPPQPGEKALPPLAEKQKEPVAAAPSPVPPVPAMASPDTAQPEKKQTSNEPPAPGSVVPSPAAPAKSESETPPLKSATAGPPPLVNPAPAPSPPMKEPEPTRPGVVAPVPAVAPPPNTSEPQAALPVIGRRKDSDVPMMPTIQNAGSPSFGEGSSRLPVVKSQSVQVKQEACQPGDTSFTALSQRLYGTDRYAAALQKFNQEHLQADPAVLQDPSRLQPGTRIQAPPPDYLEKSYPQLLRSSASPPSGTLPPVALRTPTPLSTPAVHPGPVGAPSPVVVRPALQPSTDATKSYRVPPQGLMIMQVARDTLGDGMRWPEIYRLNPNLQPQYPIPGGTEIRLPTSASVP
jgi:hypothetical protein